MPYHVCCLVAKYTQSFTRSKQYSVSAVKINLLASSGDIGLDEQTAGLGLQQHCHCS